MQPTGTGAWRCQETARRELSAARNRSRSIKRGGRITRLAPIFGMRTFTLAFVSGKISNPCFHTPFPHCFFVSSRLTPK
jgi:hypothetical protein